MLHPLYMPVRLKSGLTIYYDKFNGYVVLEKTRISSLTKGGILADEMGLGKTVEVLACILANSKIASSRQNLEGDDETPIIESPRKKLIQLVEDESIEKVDTSQGKELRVPDKWVKKNKSANYIALEKWYNETLSGISAVRREFDISKQSLSVQCICGNSSNKDLVECTSCKKHQHQSCLGYKKIFGPYFCPQCWMEKPLIDCEGTLIVTPLSLKTQWCKEISKHVKGNLKVLVYDGYSSSPIYPTNIGMYDIVITTYNVLQNELRLTESVQVSRDIFLCRDFRAPQTLDFLPAIAQSGWDVNAHTGPTVWLVMSAQTRQQWAGSNNSLVGKLLLKREVT